MKLSPYATLFEKWAFYLFFVLCGLIFFFLILPILVIIPMSLSDSQFLSFPPSGISFQWYETFFNDSEWIRALKNSVLIGVSTMILATSLGTLAAMGLFRNQFPYKTQVLAFLISPIIMPLIILAIGLYFFFSKLGLVESFLGMVIAHTILATPFVVIVVTANLKGFDLNLERAALSLGASRLQAFFKVTLPIIAPGVISGAIFAFVTSFDEVVIALFIAGTKYRTLPVKMFEGIRFEINPTITVAATFLILFSTVMLVLMEWIRVKNTRV